MTFKRSVGSFITVSFSSWQIRSSTVFLIVGQHSRHKLRCNPMHAHLFCENSMTRSITNSNLCTEIVYGTTILVDSHPYLFHFWGGCCHSWNVQTTQKFGYGSCTNHQKSVSTFQTFHFLFYPMLHRTWCTPFVHQLPLPPISENRRRLMQYTHKDTYINQTLPHATTPLGTLTHKTLPQHTLAGNSWTTGDLHVMSIVLGLLDTPS